MTDKDTSETEEEKKDPFEKKDFIYVSEIELEVSKKTVYPETSWSRSHELLKKHGYEMPTIPQFLEFVKYIRDTKKYQKIFEEITGMGTSKRAEWLNAESTFKEGKLYLNSEVIDKNTLLEERIISLDKLLDSKHTKQGLLAKGVRKLAKGDLIYCPPEENDNPSVAGFLVDEGMKCLGFWGPYFAYPSIGVRAVRPKQ